MRNRTAFGVFDETLLSTLPSTSERMNEKRPTWWLWAQPIASRRRRSRRGRTAADNRVGNCNCAASLSAETQTDPLALDLSGQKKTKQKETNSSERLTVDAVDATVRPVRQVTKFHRPLSADCRVRSKQNHWYTTVSVVVVQRNS